MKKRNSVLPWIVLGVVVLIIILVAVFGGFFKTGNLIASTAVSQPQIPTTQDVLCESVYLNTLSTPIFIGNKINTAKNTLTKSDLSSLLNDGYFSTLNSSVKMTQTLQLGSATIQNNTNPNPSQRPGVHILLGSDWNSGYLYKYGLTFSSIDFTSPSAIGQEISMMGNTFGVSPGTNSNALVLLRSPQKVSLSINGLYPFSKVVSIEDKVYTIEFISATDYSSTIKVTSSDGASETKEIPEGTSKKVDGLEVAVEYSDEDLVNNRLNTRIVVGAERFDFVNGAIVTKGSEMTPVDGTYTKIYGGVNATTELEVTYFRPDSLNDEIHVGDTHSDSIFDNLKLIFDSYDSTLGAIIRIGGCVAHKSCTDNDGGNVIYKKGVMNYWMSNWTDSCKGVYLSEYYCSAQNTPLVSVYSCANGCSNGVCIAAPSPTCTYNKKFGGYVCG